MSILVFNAVSNLYFAQDSVWEALIICFVICGSLIVGNMIRRKVPFIKKSLIPSALIAGLIIFILKYIPWFENFFEGTQETMEVITYHALGLGFVAISLKTTIRKNKSSAMKVVETGAITASTYILQGIIGLLVTIILFYIMGTFMSSGILLPMGFGQGPGQALNFGTIFEEQYGFLGGKSFGLSIAAIGFIVASVVGVIYMNILKQKGKLNVHSIEASKINNVEDFETEGEIPNAESIDKLSIQVALVICVYGLAYLLMLGLSALPLGNFGENTVKPLVWGFNFLWGVILATIVKKIMQKLKEKKIMHRQYTNSYLLDRISGLMFDVMIVAGTAAIDFYQIKDLLLPLILVCLAGTLVTFIYVNKVCKHIYPDYQYQGFFAMFGMLTGTASNGMILLREIDPKFETPAAENLVLQNLPAILFGFPILLLVTFAPKGATQTYITLSALIVLFVAFVLFLFRTKIFKKRIKENKNEDNQTQEC